jgi:integrase
VSVSSTAKNKPNRPLNQSFQKDAPVSDTQLLTISREKANDADAIYVLGPLQLAYTFARIGAVVNLKVEDYFQTGKRSMIRFREKGGKETEIPVHHKLEELLDQYLAISGLTNRPTAPLFPIAVGKTRKLGNRPATRIDAARMLKRRLKDAGLSDAFSPHSFRATGITNFLENGGTLEVAQRIAGHADSQTTKLYDRRAVRRCSWSTWKGFATKL